EGELLAVARQRGERHAEGADDVHAQLLRPHREHQQIAADAAALAEVIDLRRGLDAEPAVLARVHAIERGASAGELRGRGRGAAAGREREDRDREAAESETHGPTYHGPMSGMRTLPGAG